MHRTSRLAAVGLIAWAAAATATLAAEAPQRRADLVGYGRVEFTTVDTPGQATIGATGAAVFACEDESHADQLLSKLRADFSWDALLGPRAIRLADDAEAFASSAALGNDAGPVLAFARKQQRVYAVAAATPVALAAELRRLGLTTAAGARFTAAKRHPLSLDFYDLRAVSVYHLPLNVQDTEHGWRRYDRTALSRPLEFFAPLHFGVSLFTPYFGIDELADGAPHFISLDHMTGLTRPHGDVLMAHLGQYAAPWWMRNRFPRDIVQWDPLAISGWNGLSAMAGTHLSQHATPDAYAYAQRFTRAAIDRLKLDAGEDLGCFRTVGGGHPGDEMGLHHLSTEFMDYDDAGQQAFRHWLQETRQLDLPALGRRWFGDAAHYRSWDEVRIPSHFEFFGGLGRGTLDLLQGWQWRPDATQAEAEGWHHIGYAPGEQWTPTDLAPSMRQLFLFGSERDKELRQGKSTTAWFRKEFDPAAWLAQHKGQQVYVVAQVNDSKTEPVEVFLNDAYLGPIIPRTVRTGPIAFRATDLIKPGKNVLCLKVRNGVIRGPVFLTTEQPRRYPYLSEQDNARWVDLRDWTAQKLINGWKREARFGRQALPDVPLMFAPGGTIAYCDQFSGLKDELGIASIHFTGSGSGYMPWWSGLGYTIGSYMSSEEGGTIPDPVGLSRELAWMLLDAEGHHNYYYSAVDCMRIEQKTGWFSKNQRLLQLMGKATWQKPAVAVLRAAHSDLYFPYADQAHEWDLGRGDLQAAHHNNVYVTETEMKTGVASAYPVIFDAGTSVFDDELLAAIERHVRGGGTFVATNVTGRHALLKADAWPISRLSGFKVTGEREGRRLSVLPDNAVLRQLAGAAFQPDGAGLALQWAGDAAATSDERGTVLAQWDDGSAAVVQRKLGRGRLIVLGSTFWRSTSDRTASGAALGASLRSTFLGDLLAGVGVRPQAEADSEDVWVRRFITKNGLQQWVMAYNAGRAPAKVAVRWPMVDKPARVLDAVSGQPVEFTWQAGSVQVSNVSLDANAIRAFAVDNAAPLAAVEHWFAQKCKFESRPVHPVAADVLPTPPATAVVLASFRFRQATGTPAANETEWLTESTSGPAWKDATFGFWDEMGYAPRGTGYYRTTLKVPPAWRGRRVLLSFCSFDCPVFLEHADVYVNGQRAGEYRGHGWSNFDVLDVTPCLGGEENAIALRVDAAEVRGGFLGQLVAYPLEDLAGAIDLKANWRLFQDNRKNQPATIPLQAKGRHLETDVTIPAGWKADQVFLEFEVADRWVGIIVVNDRVIAYNQSLHPYANIMQVNLYPWIKPGEPNRIELWPRTPEDQATVKMVVKSVRIGTTAESTSR